MDVTNSKKLDIVEYNKKKYLSLIESFDCGNQGLNKLLKEVNSHHCTTMLLVTDDKIIGYFSFRCYSVVINSEVYPAIEIRSYAIDNKYQGLKLPSGITISHTFINIMIEHCGNISKNIIRAKYFVLHSLNNEKTLRFYKKVGFELLDNGNVLYDEFNNECIPMFMKIE